MDAYTQSDTTSASYEEAILEDGMTKNGTVHVYDVTTGTLLRTINKPTTLDGNAFGVGLAISSDTGVIGAIDHDMAIYSGIAHVYVDVRTSSVPEVSATGSLAALVTLFGLMALLWERRRMPPLAC